MLEIEDGYKLGITTGYILLLSNFLLLLCYIFYINYRVDFLYLCSFTPW